MTARRARARDAVQAGASVTVPEAITAAGTPRPRGRPRDDALRGRRQAEILAGATRMFAERGYAGTDVQVLADQLGVGKGTVYRYFPTKRDLLLGALSAGLDRLDQEVIAAAAAATDPLEAMELAFRGVLTYFERNPDLVELLVLERAELRDRPRSLYYDHRDRTIGPWQELLAELVAAGRLRPLPAERVTDAISDVLYALAFTHRFSGGPASGGSSAASSATAARSTDLVDLLLGGLLSDSERARRAPAAPSTPGQPKPEAKLAGRSKPARKSKRRAGRA